MKKIIVLGAGMVGSAIAKDLCRQFEVTATDINQDSLDLFAKNDSIITKRADLSKPESIQLLIKDFDLVVSAVPGFLGYQVLKTIIESGKNVVDISFMPENSIELNALAIKNNVTAIVDCGVAPGLPNFIIGFYNGIMKVSHFEYYVGGLPKVRKFPFEYKAPFSPIDVIEEYTRPARYMENGNIVIKPPMSDAELISFNQIGDLEAFNTDGLRSLLATLHEIPNMKEKTLRYPGHIRMIKALQTAGFFGLENIDINGKLIKPLDFTSKILFKNWKLKPDEKEFTVLRIIIRGIDDGKFKEIVYDLYDEYDDKSGISSMARTTGYTATAAVNLITNGLFKEKGVFPPELVGNKEICLNYLINYLDERNVKIKKTISGYQK
jgi:lysine 6-dehydrogenase